MITIAGKDMAKFQRALGHIKGGVGKAVSAAMNRAIRSGRTELGRHTRAAWAIKQKQLYATLKINNASPGNLAASIESRHSGMLKLHEFTKPKGVRKNPATLRATVRVTGGGGLGRAFVAQMKSGHIGLFARTTEKRHPIQELKTVSAPIMISQADVGEPTEKAIVLAYQKRSDHEIGRLLRSANQ
jgi:minor tail protein Z (GPZ)